MRGQSFAISAGVLYGTLGIFSALFYDYGGDSFALLLARFCAGGLIFLCIVLARRRPWPKLRVALLAVLVGPAQLAATAFLFVGFENASPGLVVLLFYIYPLLVTVGACLMFGDQLGRRRAILLGIGMAGLALTIGVPQAASVIGVLCGVGAGIFTSIFILGSQKVMARGIDPFQFVALAYGGSAVVVLAAAPFHGLSPISDEAMMYGALVVVVGTVLPALFFYSAIRLIGAGPSARLATIEPVVAVALSLVVLGDSVTLGQIVGGALVLVAVVLIATSPTQKLAS